MNLIQLKCYVIAKKYTIYTFNSEITQTGNNILAIRISSCKIMNILKVKYGSSTLIGGNSSLECNEMAE